MVVSKNADVYVKEQVNNRLGLGTEDIIDCRIDLTMFIIDVK